MSFYILCQDLFSDKFSIIGHFTGKISNNCAHAKAVSSRPSLQGRPCSEGSYKLAC